MPRKPKRPRLNDQGLTAEQWVAQIGHPVPIMDLTRLTAAWLACEDTKSYTAQYAPKPKAG
jgi:hypothetical protein